MMTRASPVFPAMPVTAPTLATRMIKKPVWTNQPSRDPAKPDCWVTQTAMGLVSIHFRKSTGLWHVDADFIHYPPSDDDEFAHIDYGISKLDSAYRVYGSTDPQELKDVIDDMHVQQMEQFIDTSFLEQGEYFAFDAEDGMINFQPTLADAQAVAESYIDQARNTLSDGNFPYEDFTVCYGLILGQGTHQVIHTVIEADKQNPDSEYGKWDVGTPILELSLQDVNLGLHLDDMQVNQFASDMKIKMAEGRIKGRGGWEDRAVCNAELFASMIAAHLYKDNQGNLIDVANLIMMLKYHGGTAPQILHQLNQMNQQ